MTENRGGLPRWSISRSPLERAAEVKAHKTEKGRRREREFTIYRSREGHRERGTEARELNVASLD